MSRIKIKSGADQGPHEPPNRPVALGAQQYSSPSPLSPRLRGESRREGFPKSFLRPFAFLCDYVT
jgi:hypothetical protein